MVTHLDDAAAQQRSSDSPRPAETLTDTTGARDPAGAELGSEPRTRRWVARALALSVFTSFVGYYGLLCLFPEWGGDFQMYCAGMSRLYRDMLHPTHEAVAAPGVQSTVYTPYLVALALFGKLFELTPFRVLQIAGVFNLVAFSAAVCFLFSRLSIHRRWELPAACFIFTTLCLRWLHFGWSSETSLTSLQYCQAYPSTLAWALAFVAFGLLEDLRRKERLLELLALTAVLSALLLIHVLTGSWVVGMVGLYGLWSSVRSRSPKPLAWAVAAVVVSVLPALVWPYSSFFGQSSLGSAREGSTFGKWPWIEFPNLYAVAIPCFAYLWFRLRRHAFLMLGMLATLAALGAWRYVGFEFGNRYAFFAAFFPQFVIAEVMALGVFGLLGPLTELSPTRARARWDEPIVSVLLVAACTAWLPSPMLAVAKQTKTWGTLWSPAAIVQRGSAHDVYHRQFSELRPFLTAEDVVLMPVSRAVFDLAALTGAAVVSAPNAHRVPDHAARARSVYAFFDPKTPHQARSETLVKYGVSKVIVERRHFFLLEELTKGFGEPIYRGDAYAVFRWPGMASGSTSSGSSGT